MSDDDVFWSYADVLILFGLVIPCFLLGVAFSHLLDAPLGAMSGKPVVILIINQATGWILLAVALATLFRIQYERPLLASLRFVRSGTPFGTTVLIGQIVALATGILYYSQPDASNIPYGLATNSSTFWLLALAATTLFSFCEEGLVRGFLQPLTVRSLGVVAGIALPALFYTLVVLSSQGWQWRGAVACGAMSVACGWTRHRTKSTTAAALVHSAYNATLFMALIVERVFPAFKK